MRIVKVPFLLSAVLLSVLSTADDKNRAISAIDFIERFISLINRDNFHIQLSVIGGSVLLQIIVVLFLNRNNNLKRDWKHTIINNAPYSFALVIILLFLYMPLEFFELSFGLKLILKIIYGVGLCIITVYIDYLRAMNKVISTKDSTFSSTAESDKLIDMINTNKHGEYKTLDAVIAVSGIIISEDNKFLLMKYGTDEKWIQPGTFFRTTINQHDDSLPNIYYEAKTALALLYEGIKRDTGLEKNHLEFLDLLSLGFDEDKSTYTMIKDQKLRPYLQGFDENFFSPAPIFIQLEHSSERKSSNKNKHIDLFYAFKLTLDPKSTQYSNLEKVKSSEVKLFSYDEVIDEVRENTIYSDLYVVFNEFLKIYRRSKFKRNAIRNCTFNTGIPIYWLRLGNVCNSNCKYCLLGNNKISITDSMAPEFDFNQLREKLKSHLTINTNRKLIISGGEVLLYKNLFTSIYELIKPQRSARRRLSAIFEKITFCTNGIIGKSVIDQIKDFHYDIKSISPDININIKFVINLPAYNEESYKELCGTDSFNNVLEFMSVLFENKFDFEINVVLTKFFKDNIKEYIALWTSCSVRRISLSYAIRNENNYGDTNLLSKSDCEIVYKELLSGDYAIEVFDNIELMIPNCNDKYCNEKQNNLTSIWQENGNVIINKTCLDKV